MKSLGLFRPYHSPEAYATPSKVAPASILIAEDDPEDRLLTIDALEDGQIEREVYFVEDGEELMNYLKNRGPFGDPQAYPTPKLILLDLNMPRKDGREALKEIKRDPELCHIPVVVLTTSKAQDDIDRSYHLGVNSYITKPVSFSGLVEIMSSLSSYWFKTVELP